jgi:hypothetical protein
VAEDDLRCQFHLTPRGWIAGTRWFFGKVEGAPVKRPTDAAATYDLHITQASPYSKEKRTWKCVWVDAKIDTASRDALYERFPQPDENMKAPTE